MRLFNLIKSNIYLLSVLLDLGRLVETRIIIRISNEVNSILRDFDNRLSFRNLHTNPLNSLGQ